MINKASCNNNNTKPRSLVYCVFDWSELRCLHIYTKSDWQSIFWTPSCFLFSHSLCHGSLLISRTSPPIYVVLLLYRALMATDDYCCMHHIDIHCCVQKHKHIVHCTILWICVLHHNISWNDNGNRNNETAFWISIGPSTKAAAVATNTVERNVWCVQCHWIKVHIQCVAFATCGCVDC